jgi:MoaA/NifB/PqqE/SkfB family radical SAM enzyme
MDEIGAIAQRVHAREAGEAVGPWTIEIYPTLACNLSCGFCDTTIRRGRPPGELPANEQIRRVEEAADLGARRIMVLGGGEPLLAPHTPELLRQAKARGLWGALTTNGTLLSPAVLDLLVEIGWDEVQVSVDGASPRTHDRLRGRDGAFARTVAAICALRARREAAGARAPVVALHTVLVRENVDELAAIVRLAAALGAERVELDALVAYRPEQARHQLGPAERDRLPQRLREGLAESARLGIATTYARLLDPQATERGAHLPKAAAAAGLAGAPCLKPWHHLVIAADGRIAPCCVRAGEGEPVTGSLADLWAQSPYLRQLRATLHAGRAEGRCAECSANILAHEHNIRDALARLDGEAAP